MSIRLNINFNNYFLNDFDLPLNSESECKSDYEDEITEDNEINTDLVVDEEYQDVIIAPSADEIRINDMTFNGMRIFDTINPGLKSSYFQVQINSKIKFMHKQTAVGY